MQKLINKTIKFRVFPTNEQIDKINNTLGSCRFIYNHFLDLSKDNNYKGYNNYSKLLTELKKQNSWLKSIDKFALQNSLRNLDSAFKRFFNKQLNYPKFKSKKKDKNKYQTNFTNGNIKINKSSIQIPKIGELKTKSHHILGFNKIINATIEKSKTNKYYIKILVEKYINFENNIDNTNNAIGIDQTTLDNSYIQLPNVVGIDLGLSTFITMSNGHTFRHLKIYEKYEKKLKKEHKKLSRKQYNSQNYKKQLIKLNKIHEKISNIRINYIHNITKYLVGNYNTICIEDLDIKSMYSHKRRNKNISDACLGIFKIQIEYKTQWYTSILKKVDRYYPSSQLCNICNYQNTEIKDLSIREWVCPICHSKHDRDVNASINILKEGLKSKI